jgi:hypothetical protein
MANVTVHDAGTLAREAVGVFHDERSLQNAVDDLLIAGFDRSALSLLASEHAVEEKLGHKYDKVAELEDDLSVPRTVFIGKDSRVEGESAVVSGLAYVGAIGAVGAIVASGGTIAAAIIGAAAAGGLGGAVGAVLARILDRHHAHYLREQLDHDGLLLWVSLRSPDQEDKVRRILTRCGAESVHAHDLPEPHYDVTKGMSYDLSFMNRLGL